MSDVARGLESIVGAGALLVWSGAAGLGALPIACPASDEEAAELLLLASRERLRVVPIGLGSKLGWSAPPARADFLLSTRRLQGVTAHEPDDGTIAARAGTTMAELRRAARSGGHLLTPDVPVPASATLGGVLAAGHSGGDRLRLGPMRHHVLGATALLAAGRRVRSGGRLVKNVTGYDLHRLWCGSQGTLCVLLEAALRLFPLPELEVSLSARRAGLEEAQEAAAGLLAASVDPLSLALHPEGNGGGWRVHLHLAGRERTVEHEAERARSLLGEAETRRGDAAREVAEHVRDLEQPRGLWRHLRVASPPGAVAGCAGILQRTAHERELAAHLLVHPGVATIDALLVPLAASARIPLAELAPGLRAELAALGATLALRRFPVDAPPELEPAGSPDAGLETMRRLRESLDPTRVFAAERLVRGLVS